MLIALKLLTGFNCYILAMTGMLPHSERLWRSFMQGETYCSLVLLLPTLLPRRVGRPYAVVLYVCLASLTAANFLHAYLYKTPLAPYLLDVIQETYISEMREFINFFLDMSAWYHLLIPLLVPLPFVILSLRCGESSGKFKILFAVTILAIFGTRILQLGVATSVRSSFLADFVLTCIDDRKEKQQLVASLTVLPDLPKNIHKTGAPGRLVVLIIGESASRNHYSLYNYRRSTTPKLDARKKELLVFTDVVSPHGQTVASLQKSLTFADHEGAAARCSFVDVFKSAGYHVITLSDQPHLGPHETAASRLLDRSHEARYFNRSNSISEQYSESASWDEVLLEPFKKTLSYQGDLLVVLHLMGNHAAYDRRFPESATRFHDIPPAAQDYPLQEEQIQKINDYDTSVAYTDALLDRFLSLTEQQGRSSAVIYFSDHGEAVYDDGHTLGHTDAVPSRYMFEIPLVIWLSPEYRQECPELSRRIQGYQKRPWQTDDLIYSLFSLAGITFENFKEHKDILSPNFVPKKRVIAGQNYDDLYPKRISPKSFPE